jgi:uncharacterized protein (DUF305 family)
VINVKKELIIAGIIGLLIGILIYPLFFGMWSLGGFGWNHMMGSQNSRFSMMGSGMQGNLDGHFIEQMIPHHDDAILMAEIALVQAEHDEIKLLAKNIKKSQSEENTKMRSWYKEWYGAEVSKTSMGMGRSMMMGGMTDIPELTSAKPFDKEFIEQMIPHHQMAIMMTSMMLQGTQREEMRELAQDIIDAQSKEIVQMQSWYDEWYG